MSLSVHDLSMRWNRRQFFGREGIRLGTHALAVLAGQRLLANHATATDLQRPAAREVHPDLPGLPHFAQRAKAIIYLHMNGCPSQIDT
ncbi:MAG: hypothetical protein ACK56G_14130, partial [Pirellulaceae bacterium]